jgi:hypothetical protein
MYPTLPSSCDVTPLPGLAGVEIKMELKPRPVSLLSIEGVEANFTMATRAVGTVLMIVECKYREMIMKYPRARALLVL